MPTASTSSKKLNKSAFVRSLPSTLSPKEVVVRAKAAGITLTDKYVSTIRYNAKTSAKAKSPTKTVAANAPAAAPAPSVAVKRGPGRPRKVVTASNGNGAAKVHAGSLDAMIEAIVERKVNEILKTRLRSLLG
jgi:hypothetical protein